MYLWCEDTFVSLWNRLLANWENSLVISICFRLFSFYLYNCRLSSSGTYKGCLPPVKMVYIMIPHDHISTLLVYCLARMTSGAMYITVPQCSLTWSWSWYLAERPKSMTLQLLKSCKSRIKMLSISRIRIKESSYPASNHGALCYGRGCKPQHSRCLALSHSLLDPKMASLFIGSAP